MPLYYFIISTRSNVCISRLEHINNITICNTPKRKVSKDDDNSLTEHESNRISELERQINELKSKLHDQNQLNNDLLAKLGASHDKLKIVEKELQECNRLSKKKDNKLNDIIDLQNNSTRKIIDECVSFNLNQLSHPLSTISNIYNADTLEASVRESCPSVTFMIKNIKDIYMNIINCRCTDDNREKCYKKMEIQLRLFMGSLIGIGREDVYDDHFAWLLGLNIYPLSHSEKLYDVLSKIIVGYPSGKRFRDNLTRYDEKVQVQVSAAPNQLTSSFGVTVYDNACKNYKGAKTSKGGTENERITSVVTQRILIQRGIIGKEDLVYELYHGGRSAPRYDRKMDYKTDRPFLPLSIPTPDSNDIHSEKDYQDNEIYGYLKQRLAMMLDSDLPDLWRNICLECEREKQTPTCDNSLANKYKYCSICKQQYKVTKIKCENFNCREVTGYMLVTASTVECDEANVSDTKFRSNRLDIDNIVYNNYIIAKPVENEVTGELKLEYHYAKIESNSDSILPDTLPHLVEHDPWCLITGLKQIIKNPSGEKAIKEILLQICKDVNLRGDGMNLEKEIVEVWFYSSDAGANIADIIRKAPESSPLKNLRYLMGSGHETMCFNVVVLKLLRYMGYTDLGKLHSYQSPGAENFLFGNWDMHKSTDFLMIYVRSLMTDFYLLRSLTMLNITLTKEYFNTVCDRVITHCLINDSVMNDQHHMNHKFVVIDMLASLAIAKKSLLRNSKVMSDASRKGILPFLAPLGHFTYAKAILLDLESCFLSVKIVRKIRYMFYSANGKGLDFCLEELIKVFKTFVGPETKIGYSIANTLMNIVPKLSEIFNERIGIKEKSIACYRNEEDYMPEYIAGLKLLASLSTSKQVPNRDIVLTLNGNHQLLTELNPLNIKKQGENDLIKYSGNSDLDNRRFDSKLIYTSNKQLIYYNSTVEDEYAESD